MDGHVVNYAVFREGVYRHECGGIFNDLNDAIDAAVTLAKQEKDNYHHFVIEEYALNEVKLHPFNAIVTVRRLDNAIVVSHAQKGIIAEIPLKEEANG